MAGSGRQNADPLLIAALLGGATLAEAAKQAGVSEQTARRRLHNPEFRKRLAAAEAELIDIATRAVAGAMGKAVAKLEVLLEADSDNVQLGACRTILEFGQKWRSQRVVEERIATLELSIAALERSEAERNKHG